MPLEELLAIYRYEASAGSSIDSSSGDLTDELPDMTLDKVRTSCYLIIVQLLNRFVKAIGDKCTSVYL